MRRARRRGRCPLGDRDPRSPPFPPGRAHAQLAESRERRDPEPPGVAGSGHARSVRRRGRGRAGRCVRGFGRRGARHTRWRRRRRHLLRPAADHRRRAEGAGRSLPRVRRRRRQHDHRRRLLLLEHQPGVLGRGHGARDRGAVLVRERRPCEPRRHPLATVLRVRARARLDGGERCVPAARFDRRERTRGRESSSLDSVAGDDAPGVERRKASALPAGRQRLLVRRVGRRRPCELAAGSSKPCRSNVRVSVSVRRRAA